MHGHSFEQIWTKFVTWYQYTLRMVMGRLESATHVRWLALRAPSIIIIIIIIIISALITVKWPSAHYNSQ